MPELLIRLAGTQDADDFRSVLQEVLTLAAVPEFGDRVEARRVLAEVSWCIHPSRPDGRELHADELSRIFQLIVNPDLGRPRVAREIADWAAIAPPAVIRGLLAGAKSQGRSADDACYSGMMRILEPVLAGRWIDEHGLLADWHPRRPRLRAGPATKPDSAPCVPSASAPDAAGHSGGQVAGLVVAGQERHSVAVGGHARRPAELGLRLGGGDAQAAPGD